MKLQMQTIVRADGTLSESWGFDGDLIDLAAAADIILGSVSDDMAACAARFATSSYEALVEGEPEDVPDS